MSPEAYARKLAYNREYSRTHQRKRKRPTRVLTPEQRERKRERERNRVRYRKCLACGEEYGAQDGKQKTCSRKCSDNLRGRGQPKPKASPIYPMNCSECGRSFIARRRNTRCCSPACVIKRDYRLNKPRYLKHAHIRNARKKRVYQEDVDLIRVYERDRWVCQLCGQPVKRETEIKHDPEMASLDHIIPIAKGGAHSYENTQCSHLRCNKAKRDRTPTLVA